MAYERWLGDHCPACRQKRSEWLDENGVELRDPPFEIVNVLCPSCEWLGDHQEEEAERQKADGQKKRHGIHFGFRRVRRDANDDVS